MTAAGRAVRVVSTFVLVAGFWSLVWAQAGPPPGGPPPGPPPAGGPPGPGGPPGGPGGRGAPPPRSPREAAPVDLTGYWVSVVTEDWRFRMLTPPKGELIGVPLTDGAKKIAEAWDPARDEAAGLQCRGYGAPPLMRLPGRAHITWEDDTTLKLEYDTGQQTRRLHFGGAPPAGAEASWQGYSVAEWEREVSGLPSGQRPIGGLGRAFGPPVALTRSLKVVTTGLRPGYLRKNGIPYGGNAVLTEYLDLRTEQSGDTWFTVVSIVEDPENLTGPYITSSDFKKEPDGSKWMPLPCRAK